MLNQQLIRSISMKNITNKLFVSVAVICIATYVCYNIYQGYVNSKTNNTSFPNLEMTNRLNNNEYLADQYGEYSDMSWKKLLSSKPRLYRSRGYPPANKEEARMWQWWSAMQRADPDHAWKTPIEFYGIVVDQDEHAIAGATVNYCWTEIAHVGQAQTHSDSNGKFTINNIVGNGVSVRVFLRNCMNSFTSEGKYNYGDEFHDKDFHVPDSNNPVKFMLHTSNPDKNVVWNNYQESIARDNTILWVNPFDKAPVSEQTALFGVQCKTEYTFQRGSNGNYTAALIAAPGGGIALNQGEEYMLEAPINGYQEIVQFQQYVTNKQFKPDLPLSFYFRTADGSYGTVPNAWLSHCRWFSGCIVLNTNRSRILDCGSWVIPSVMNDRRLHPELFK